jgi:hypothetical protein
MRKIDEVSIGEDYVYPVAAWCVAVISNCKSFADIGTHGIWRYAIGVHFELMYWAWLLFVSYSVLSMLFV